MFKIITASQPLTVNNVVVLIYGQPGVGKSSIGFTASQERVLVLDFDKGAHRSAFRKDILQIEQWSDVLELMKDKETLSRYDTIVIDTVGRCLDFIIASFDRSTNKLLTRNGNPTMAGWGELKAIFQTFIRQATTLNKDIVLIAHEKEYSENDQTILRPDVSGGSYAEIFKIADFVGRVFKINKTTTLDFEPCERYLGKNSARISAIDVPDFTSQPNFLGDLLVQMKGALNKTTDTQKEIISKVTQYKSLVADCKNAADLNNILAKAANEVREVKIQLKAICDTQARSIGATFVVEDKQYKMNEVKAEEPAPKTKRKAPEPIAELAPVQTPEPELVEAEGDDW